MSVYDFMNFALTLFIVGGLSGALVSVLKDWWI